ncbi:MAG: ion transporter [Spirochaetes bacterium]|nr:ion transporter [Spirochaetota bacterium]
MINPEKSFKTWWDNIILIATIIVAFETPLMLVFKIPIQGKYLIFSLVITLIYSADIIINFNTGIRNNGEMLLDRGEAASRYIRGWFWPDILAAVPFELIFIATPVFGLNRIFRIFKIIRLFKLMRISQTLNKFKTKNIINPSIFRMFILVFWILIATHFIACGWLFMMDYPKTMSMFDSYLKAYYWTATTVTTLGYGDLTPQTNGQMIYATFIMITGAGMYGFVIGNIANLIANIDIAKAQYREKMEKINTFMKYRNIPHELQLKINDYYNYLWESRRGYDENSVLSDLPIPLKTDVSLFLNKEIIEKVPIFKGATGNFIKDIILHLEPIVFTPNDYIVKKGDMGTDMFFISKGSVDVVSEDGNIVYATLTSGQFFGEIALLLSSPRTASIRSNSYCDLYRLDKSTFEHVLHRYPEFETDIKVLAEKRKAELQNGI